MISLFNFSSSKKQDLKPVSQLQIERYLGKWFEIARFNHRFERGLSHVTAEYQRLDNGLIRVINSGYQKERDKNRQIIGKAKTTANPGLLRVSFFWNFDADYRILAIGPDYEWALVGAGRSTRYLWLLSRQPELSESVKNEMLQEATRRGYDIHKLLFIDHALQVQK